jgi:hypothetical protein
MVIFFTIKRYNNYIFNCLLKTKILSLSDQDYETINTIIVNKEYLNFIHSVDDRAIIEATLYKLVNDKYVKINLKVNIKYIKLKNKLHINYI